MPSNAPKLAKKAANAAKNTPDGKAKAPQDVSAPPSDPVLVIDFAQKHVYFDRQLQQVLTKVEAGQAGANYDVVSHIPAEDGSGKLQIGRLNESYGANLTEVVSKMQAFGIPMGRIHTSIEPSNQVTTQQVSIAVR